MTIARVRKTSTMIQLYNVHRTKNDDGVTKGKRLARAITAEQIGPTIAADIGAQFERHVGHAKYGQDIARSIRAENYPFYSVYPEDVGVGIYLITPI